MVDFFRAVGEFRFLQYALLTGLLASVACGIVGSYVVTRRISYVAGAISHFILGGMGAARYFSVVHQITWLTPLGGATVAALAAAVIIGMVSLKARQREDTVIGSVWAIGMAAGILFIASTPGYNEDLMSYLFGNILMVTPADLGLIAGLDLLVVAVSFLFYNKFLAICFDEEFARLRGVKTDLFYLMLLCLTALTVVLLVTVVGIILVIALITLPAAIAGYFTNSLARMMIIASLVSLVCTTLGLALSYAPDLPAGATIIVLAGFIYLAVTGLAKFKYRRR